MSLPIRIEWRTLRSAVCTGISHLPRLWPRNRLTHRSVRVATIASPLRRVPWQHRSTTTVVSTSRFALSSVFQFVRASLPDTNRRRRFRIAFGLGVAALTARDGHAQAQLLYFALAGEGTASALIDRGAKEALIADGGVQGARGIGGARIGNEDVLTALSRRGIERIIISCSHPHADHMKGLEEMLQDERILDFELTFIDASELYEKDPTGLYTQYRTKWGQRANLNAIPYSSARSRDAFAGVAAKRTTVRLSNFVYVPKDVSADPHDNSVILQFALGSGRRAFRVVDFDDASTELVNRWASEGVRADAVVFPHHGSRHNKLDAVLTSSNSGVRHVIVPVNRRNKHLHPSPEVLYRLLERFGVDDVHVTDSDLGDNVTISARGISRSVTKKAYRLRLQDFVQQSIDQHKSRIRARIEALPASASADEDRDVQRYRRGIVDLAKSLALIQATAVNASTRYGGEWKGGGSASASAATAGGPNGPNSPKGSPFPRGSTGSSDGSSRYVSLADSIIKSKSCRDAEDRRAARHLLLFECEMRPGRPNWGGVVVGNAVRGDRLASIEFISASDRDVTEAAGSESVQIRVTTPDGMVGYYADVTSTELWAAHRFVQPTGYAKGEINALSGAIGLVGLRGKTNSGDWIFAVSPAISGTRVAIDAMRLDLLLANIQARASREGSGDLPAPLRDVEWPDTVYSTYQWYDAESSVLIRNGVVRVSPLGGELSCLMRLRLFPRAERPNSAQRREFEESISAYLRLEVEKKVKEMNAALGSGDRSRVAALAARSTKLSVEQRTAPARLVRMIESSQNWRTEVRSVPGLSGSLKSLCERFDALQTIDKFARTVALLRRYVESTNRPLPDLPDWIVPRLRETPNVMAVTDALEMPRERLQARPIFVSEATDIQRDSSAASADSLTRQGLIARAISLFRSHWPWIVMGLVVGVAGLVLFVMRR
jgi:beta-lactamase superfamily II metal-dependent hydrolase